MGGAAGKRAGIVQRVVYVVLYSVWCVCVCVVGVCRSSPPAMPQYFTFAITHSYHQHQHHHYNHLLHLLSSCLDDRTPSCLQLECGYTVIDVDGYGCEVFPMLCILTQPTGTITTPSSLSPVLPSLAKLCALLPLPSP